jgi:hypothetical protein
MARRRRAGRVPERAPITRLLLVAAMLVAAAVAALPGAATARPARPTDRDQPLRDGCQRPSLANVILVNSPEWVYVNHSTAIRRGSGIVRVAHPTPVDQPGTHDWFDMNANLVPDRSSRYLVAGDRKAGTNNYSGGESGDTGEGGESEAEEFARLHYEWEEGSYPKFAWPSDGDRTTVWGSWIWDCGHWTTGAEVTGERSELHPLNASVVTRQNGARARRGEKETDAWISSSGTFAHVTEECARKGTPQSDGTYGPTFFDCAANAPREHKTTPAQLRQKLAKSYSFAVRAPKRPRGAKRLVLRSARKGARKGKVRERVRRTKTGFRVTVKPRSKNLRWGKSYFARWKSRKSRATRLKVTFNSLLVVHADPDTSEGGTDPAGEHIALYLDLNGFWQGIHGWAPKLFAAQDNMRLKLNRSVPVTVQRGRGVNLFVMGRECDGPSGVTLFGHFVPRTKPCPFNRTESKISAHNNDDPGTILDRYKSAKAALGKHTTKSRATVFIPHTGEVSFFNGVQGNDVYRLTYTVRRVR